jgi:methionyl-tRNA formyltransferase
MFRALVESPHTIVAVATRPDHAPPGRKPPPNPMRAAAGAAGIGILDPERVNEPAAVASLAALRPDLFVVCDYGQILSRDLLSVPPLGGINLHGSLLPRHRGAAPVQWAIREGDAVSGVSVIHMTPALDAGNVIVARSTPVGPRETAAELEPRLAELGTGAVIDAVERMQAAVAATGTVVGIGIPQDTGKATRAPRLSKQDGIVDWSLPAATIERLRRALEPWPRLTTFYTRGDGERQRLVLEDVEVADRPGTTGSATAPGSVLDTSDGRIVVACGGGTAAAITRVVPEGRRGMSAADYLRGSPLLPGAVLG